MSNGRTPPILRAAEAGDIPALVRLAGELGYASTEADMAQRLQALAGAAYFLRVAVDAGGQVVGWVNAEERFSLESGRFHEVTGLVVAAAARRTGAGAALLTEAERWAAARGGRRLRVRCNVHRDAAHAFYRTAGYHAGKTQHVFEKALALQGVFSV